MLSLNAYVGEEKIGKYDRLNFDKEVGIFDSS